MRARDALLPARLFLRAIHVCTSIIYMSITHKNVINANVRRARMPGPCTTSRRRRIAHARTFTWRRQHIDGAIACRARRLDTIQASSTLCTWTRHALSTMIIARVTHCLPRGSSCAPYIHVCTSKIDTAVKIIIY